MGSARTSPHISGEHTNLKAGGGAHRNQQRSTLWPQVANTVCSFVVVGVIGGTCTALIVTLLNAPFVSLGHILLRRLYYHIPCSIPSRALEAFADASPRSTLILASIGSAIISLPWFLTGTAINYTTQTKRNADAADGSEHMPDGKVMNRPSLPPLVRSVLTFAWLVFAAPLGAIVYRLTLDVPTGGSPRALGATHAAVAAIVGRLVVYVIQATTQRTVAFWGSETASAAGAELPVLEADEGGAVGSYADDSRTSDC